MTFEFLKSRLLTAAVNKDERDEKTFLEESKRILENQETNPNRVGCPPSEFLRKLAAHEVAMEELRIWSRHLSRCGECYREFDSMKPKFDPVRAGLKNTLQRLIGRSRKKK